MGFTTPCFIRKNTKELRDKLKELGYCIIGESLICIKTNVCGKISIAEQSYEFELNDRIDCEKNEELFLAIAALRDDTDIHQWFIMDIEAYLNLPKGKWFKATSLGGGHHVGCQIEPFYCHKATVEELIEHFK